MTKRDFYFVVNVVARAENSDQALDLVYGLKGSKGVSIEDVNQMEDEDE